MNYDFNKILKLLNQSSDVLLWPGGGDIFAVMKLEHYQRLNKLADCAKVEDLSEEELIMKINSDIAEWRLNQNLDDDFLSDFREKKACEEQPGIEADEQYYLEPLD